MVIKNLTPHAIRVRGIQGALSTTDTTFPPWGVVARVATSRSQAGAVAGLPVFVDTGITGITGLPAPEEGVILLVSLAVRQAVPERADICSPGELIRDEIGRPVGCVGLVFNVRPECDDDKNAFTHPGQPVQAPNWRDSLVIAIVKAGGEILSLHPTLGAATAAYFSLPSRDQAFVRLLTGDIIGLSPVSWNYTGGGGYRQEDRRLSLLPNPRTEIQQRWDAAGGCPAGIFRRIDDQGRAVPGEQGLVYPDDTVRDGYHIARAADAEKVSIGEDIRVGTGGAWNGSIAVVERIGKPYSMVIDSVVTDEDHSFSGTRIVGKTTVLVRRIYFRDIQSISAQ